MQIVLYKALWHGAKVTVSVSFIIGFYLFFSSRAVIGSVNNYTLVYVIISMGLFSIILIDPQICTYRVYRMRLPRYVGL